MIYMYDLLGTGERYGPIAHTYPQHCTIFFVPLNNENKAKAKWCCDLLITSCATRGTLPLSSNSAILLACIFGNS